MPRVDKRRVLALTADRPATLSASCCFYKARPPGSALYGMAHKGSPFGIVSLPVTIILSLLSSAIASRSVEENPATVQRLDVLSVGGEDGHWGREEGQGWRMSGFPTSLFLPPTARRVSVELGETPCP